MIPYTNAAPLIFPNPGVGYWWVIQEDGLWLWSPPAVQVSIFWPVLVAVVLAGCLGWAVVEMWLQSRKLGYPA